MKSEFARVFGIEFHAVLMRGSQYNVESMMFRVAFPENFIMLTPSANQVTFYDFKYNRLIFICV